MDGHWPSFLADSVLSPTLSLPFPEPTCSNPNPFFPGSSYRAFLRLYLSTDNDKFLKPVYLAIIQSNGCVPSMTMDIQHDDTTFVQFYTNLLSICYLQ